MERRTLLAARTVAVLWAGWWSFFAVATAASEPASSWVMRLPAIVAVFVFLGSAVVAWRYANVGGTLLIGEGLFVCAACAGGFFQARPASIAFLVLTLALPPIVAGGLFLASWRSSAGHLHA